MTSDERPVPVHDMQYVYDSLGAPRPPGLVTRAEHLAWCKERALEYVDAGDYRTAWASMTSDLGKHPETRDHDAIALGTMLLMIGENANVDDMRKFIEGCN